MFLTKPQKIKINEEINGFYMDYKEIMIDKLNCFLLIEIKSQKI